MFVIIFILCKIKQKYVKKYIDYFITCTIFQNINHLNTTINFIKSYIDLLNFKVVNTNHVYDLNDFNHSSELSVYYVLNF